MKITNHDISDFLLTVDESLREDLFHLIALFSKIIPEPPKMWDQIIGFSYLRYEYENGDKSETPLIGISTRKGGFTLYIHEDVTRFPRLEYLGKYKVDKDRLYIDKLADIDMDVLKELIKEAIADTVHLPFFPLDDPSED